MKISIIIPTYNEEATIGALVSFLKNNGREAIAEIIVVDGGSQDQTLTLAGEAGAIALLAPQKGRATQMNFGVSQATGDIFYFVHADSLPPATYVKDILTAITEGFVIGCYRFRFDSKKLLLKINSYCTRFDRIMCRGGDQSLFVTRAVFNEFKGYRNEFVIMEEYDFIRRVRQKYAFKIIPKDVLVSARKYDQNGYLRVNLANLTVFLLYLAGWSPYKLLNIYKRLINHPKF